MNKFIHVILASVLLFSLFFLIFSPWFLHSEIIGGDWPYFHQENIQTFHFLPPVWSAMQGNGLGGNVLVYPLDSYLYTTGWIFSQILSLPWNVTYKIFWFGMFLLIGIYAARSLIKKVFPQLPLSYQVIGIICYLANTYILMVVGGGQMGVALGYAIAPLALLTFINSINQNIRASLLAGLLFSLLVLFDFRLAYLVLIAFLCYLPFVLRYSKSKINLLKLTVYALAIPLLVMSLLHMFWLLPSLFTFQGSVTQLGQAYTQASAVHFFSFARFENALGLLHPNWPENIFGKIGFMKAEFLLLPIVAFSALLFTVERKYKPYILYFCFLGLLGAFLAKGSNDLFGGLYVWLFDHVPGFVMFRDPTKWHLFIAIAYSALIPFTLYNLTKVKRFVLLKFSYIIPVVFFFYFFYLIQPALLGELGGTFKKGEVPSEYVRLKELLANDDRFSRTLWLPRIQRFGFNNQTHPAVEASALFNATSSAEMMQALHRKETAKELADLSIRYVVIPYDSEEEIFLKDRKYFHNERIAIETAVDKLPWLVKATESGRLSIYQIKNPKQHFWLENEGTIGSVKESDAQYLLTIKTEKPNTIIFAEKYNPYWEAKIDNSLLVHKNYHGLNSFVLPENGSHTIIVNYSIEKYFIIGRFISLSALIFILGLFIYKKFKES